jgi:hypothetical protein
MLCPTAIKSACGVCFSRLFLVCLIIGSHPKQPENIDQPFVRFENMRTSRTRCLRNPLDHRVDVTHKIYVFSLVKIFCENPNRREKIAFFRLQNGPVKNKSNKFFRGTTKNTFFETIKSPFVKIFQ